MDDRVVDEAHTNSNHLVHKRRPCICILSLSSSCSSLFESIRPLYLFVHRALRTLHICRKAVTIIATVVLRNMAFVVCVMYCYVLMQSASIFVMCLRIFASLAYSGYGFVVHQCTSRASMQYIHVDMSSWITFLYNYCLLS
jgi:hypothetical protein